MRPFVALLRKELRHYFGSPLVYLVGAAFLAYTGYAFHADLIQFLTFGFGLNIMENLWQVVFLDVRLGILLSVPLLTMRLLAEERRLGTLELLLTYPMTDRAVVAAKLVACCAVIALLLACTAAYPIWLHALQPFPAAPVAAGFLGLFLLGAACTAYGLFVSACTDSQVLAGFLTLLPLLLLWFLSWNEATSPGGTASVVQAVSLFNHFQPFTVGVIDLRDLFYFGMLVAGFTWAALRVLEGRQWRGAR